MAKERVECIKESDSDIVEEDEIKVRLILITEAKVQRTIVSLLFLVYWEVGLS